MIEILIVGVIVAAILGAFVLIMRWGMKAKDETMHATDRLHAQTKLADEAIAALVVDRDTWKQKADVATAQLAAAKVRLTLAEAQRNAAFKDERAHVAEELRTTDAAGAARVGNLVLSRPLPSLPKTGDTGSSDSDRGAVGVRPAGPAKPPP